MFDVFKNRLEIRGTLVTVTALRISAGRSMEPIGSDLPVIKDIYGQPLIPGASFKGALRSRLESFLRGILGSDRHLVANPANENEWSISASEMKELKDQYNNDRLLTDAIINQTDLVSHLFGSPWLASKFQVRDLTVKPDTWFGQYQERDGVAIDRDTETAAEGKLYDFQVIPAGTLFEFQAVVENAAEWELGMLIIGLHQFETEQIPLGGGRSRGLGVVRLEIEEMRWIDVEGHPELLLEYLRKLVNQDSDIYKNATDYQDRWIQKLIEYLNSKIPDPKATAV
ncbi:type III CRISPR-associated RAMP protein Csx7 [Oscillatoria salina]|uniref:type III CRISPR-associated RAMP protein Csx7 n=1 Tax=Oscillatoria salina TaxID=331517 RepID=UPI0013BA5C22|nr:CRISPR-associated RAMP protein Csx7 [Oscillatoria salina]MBZ8181457.1 CRISPR-associated RAMP protein [Oscillatoria salina IIICB1]NET88413.1 CRISPR-associated RAMP protein [Kamptonema sp. SIO1D9]